MSIAPSPSDRHRGSLRARWLDVLVLGLCCGVFGFVAGPFGIAAGVVTGAIWYRWGIPYAIATGTVLLVTLTPAGLEPAPVVLIAGAFTALILAAAIRRGAPRRVLPVGILAPGVFGTVAWVIVAQGSLWLAAATVLGVVALTVYALHRLALVRLGLVPAESETHEQAATTQS